MLHFILCSKAALSAYVTTPPMLPLPPLFLVALPAPTSSAAVATSTAAVATSIAAVATVEVEAQARWTMG